MAACTNNAVAFSKMLMPDSAFGAAIDPVAAGETVPAQLAPRPWRGCRKIPVSPGKIRGFRLAKRPCEARFTRPQIGGEWHPNSGCFCPQSRLPKAADHAAERTRAPAPRNHREAAERTGGFEILAQRPAGGIDGLAGVAAVFAGNRHLLRGAPGRRPDF